MLRLSDSEASKITEAVTPIFHGHLNNFSAGKYPDIEYSQLRTDFLVMATVSEPHIRRALLWKYGHWNKTHFPERHDVLIRRIADLWPGLAATLPVTPNMAFLSTYDVWRSLC